MKSYLLLFFVFISFVIFSQSNAELAEVYFNKSEYEKSTIYYKKAIREKTQFQSLYENYRTTLIKLKDYKSLDKLSSSATKQYPSHHNYIIDQIINNKLKGSTVVFIKELDKYKKAIRKVKSMVLTSGEHLLKRNLDKEAIDLYQVSRKGLNDKNLYAYELANIYQKNNKKRLMVDEYLNHLEINKSDIETIQNTLQTELSEDGDLDILIDKLYLKIGDSDITLFPQLLVWAFLQKRDFFNAFVQERAIDKRQQLQGKRLITFSKVCDENRQYETLISIYEYLTKEYPNHYNYTVFKRKLIDAKKQNIITAYPVDTVLVRSIIFEYDKLLKSIRSNNERASVLLSQAKLHGYYLNNQLKATELLKSIEQDTRVKRALRFRVKIELADLYLYQDDAQASLLYFQIASEMKETELGHEAKLKNARYFFYQGDFQLAKSQLDVLKRATTRKISNDALDLSVLIQNNLELDTSANALQDYANADLLIFQHKYKLANNQFVSMLSRYKNHTLTDEVYWKIAEVQLKMNNNELAASFYKKIISEYPDDILADDAIFTLAKLYETVLFDKVKSQEMYKKILFEYRGSIYLEESRKRFRILRGDTL